MNITEIVCRERERRRLLLDEKEDNTIDLFKKIGLYQTEEETIPLSDDPEHSQERLDVLGKQAPPKKATYTPSETTIVDPSKRMTKAQLKDEAKDILIDNKFDAVMNQLTKNRKTLWSVDFSTICPKRLYGVACPYCYVDDSRMLRCNAKNMTIYTKFDRDFFKLTAEDIRRLNAVGGIRLFSFGDYVKPPDTPQEDDVLGNMDNDIKSFLDTALKHGLLVKVITKQADFVRKFHDHPAICVINVSIDNIAKIKNGKFEIYGMNWAVAADLRDRFPKVKIRCAAMNVNDLVEMIDISDVVTLNHAMSMEKQRDFLRDKNGHVQYYKKDVELAEIGDVKVTGSLQELMQSGKIVEKNDGLYFIRPSSKKGAIDEKDYDTTPLEQKIFTPRDKIVGVKQYRVEIESSKKAGTKKKWVDAEDGEFKDGKFVVTDASSGEKKELPVIDERIVTKFKVRKIARAGTPIFKRYPDKEIGSSEPGNEADYRGDIMSTRLSDELVVAPRAHTKGAYEKYLAWKNKQNNERKNDVKESFGPKTKEEIFRIVNEAMTCAAKGVYQIEDRVVLLEAAKKSKPNNVGLGIKVFSDNVKKRILEFVLQYSARVTNEAQGKFEISNSEVIDQARKKLLEELEEDFKTLNKRGINFEKDFDNIKIHQKEFFVKLQRKLCCSGSVCEKCSNLCGLDINELAERHIGLEVKAIKGLNAKCDDPYQRKKWQLFKAREILQKAEDEAAELEQREPRIITIKQIMKMPEWEKLKEIAIEKTGIMKVADVKSILKHAIEQREITDEVLEV